MTLYVFPRTDFVRVLVVRYISFVRFVRASYGFCTGVVCCDIIIEIE